MSPDDVSKAFWRAAESALGNEDVEVATMMGFPCLRCKGAFFASSDRKNGDLIVKLPETRVAALIAAGEAAPFAPSGRTFREWARIPERDPRRWRLLIGEALRFAQPHRDGASARSRTQA